MTTQIQYVSDIHLETRPNASKRIFETILNPSAPYLALCGDIGYPESHLFEPFLNYCSNSFKEVFYVAGNHEFYNNTKSLRLLKIKEKMVSELGEETFKRYAQQFQLDTKEDRINKIRQICEKYPNIHFLDREQYKIPDTNIIILGCTLWSNIKMDPYVIRYFNDFQRIVYTLLEAGFEGQPKEEAILTPYEYNEWNKEDSAFLETTIPKTIEDNPDCKILVLTHHCPTYDVIIERYKEHDPNNTNSFFANSNLTHLMGKNVKGWLCGHTHGCKNINIQGTTIATNTYGYEGESIQGFKLDVVIEI